MKSNDILVKEFFRIKDLYLSGEIHLHHLASKIEIIIENMQKKITEESFLVALDCVYLIEDINGLSLDDERYPTLKENTLITKALLEIEMIIKKNIEEDNF